MPPQSNLMQTVIRRGADLTGIAKGAKITGKIENLSNIHQIYFYATIADGTAFTVAQFLTDVGDIKVRVNGELIIEASAAQLLALYKYHNDQHTAHTVTGVLPVYFPRQHLPVADLNRGFALGMVAEDGIGHNVLTYEFNVLSPATLVLSAVEVLYEHDLRPPEKMGHHIRILRHDRTFSGTGVQTIADMPKDKIGTAALCYHFDKAGIDRMTVKVDGKDRWEDVHTDVLAVQQHRAGRVPQSSMTHVDFSIHNDLGSMLPLGVGNIVDLQIKPDWGTDPSGSYQILAEEIHQGL